MKPPRSSRVPVGRIAGLATVLALLVAHDARADVLTPTTMNVFGISAGSPMTAVDAICKVPRVTCMRRTRLHSTGALDRIRIDLPGGPYWRAYVTAKGGAVLAVKGRYRSEDPNRIAVLTQTFGKPAAFRRGLIEWTTASGVVVSARERDIQFASPATATAKGFPLTAQAFLAQPVKRIAIRPAAAAPVAPARILAPGPGLQALVQGALRWPFREPTPRVTTTMRIPIKITLNMLTCVVEQDPITFLHSDDPYLEIRGLHTNPAFVQPWSHERRFDDVNAGDVKHVSQDVFADGDPRRTVGFGEAVGVEVTLRESDIVHDDEIDFAYPIFDYAFALANQNKTIPFTENLNGDGGSYTLSYTVEVGAGAADPAPAQHAIAYRPVAAFPYAGSYTGFVANQPAAASLTFLASKDPAFPHGELWGTFKDGATTARVFTMRLQGASGELLVRYPNGSSGLMNLYLAYNAPHCILTGTITVGDVTRGVSLAGGACWRIKVNPNLDPPRRESAAGQ